MRRLSVILIATAAIASPVLAQSRPAPQQPRQEQPARAVYVCGSDEVTRASFRQTYGSDPRFVTAEQAAQAAQRNERWSQPRCMTERQHGRYQQLTAERARTP